MSTWKSAGKVRMTPKGEWVANTSYEVLDLVSNTDKTIFYIAKQDVPSGVSLTNEEYWVVVLDSTTGVRAKAPELVASYINEFGPRQAFNIFVRMAINDGVSLNDAVTLFYSNAKTGKIYGVEFYRFDVSPSSIGTKTHDNANMVCEPSTNTVAGRDDYANLALFMPININYNWDDTTNLEPTITEIEGITDGFSLSNPNGLAGVLQMGAWINMWSDGNKKYRLYSDTQINAEYVPLPQCVRAKDNSFRPWMIHAKYVAGINSNDKLTSASGLSPVSASPSSRIYKNTSHDNQIVLWRKLGAAYSGESLCDRTFIELMFEIKYARLGNSGLIEGCSSYDIISQIALGESGVKRVLLTETDGAKYIVGSTVSVGTGNDRTNATSHDIVDHYRITKITTAAIDGTNYIALQLDSSDDFDTEIGQYVISEPWYSGSSDNIMGNDGSPYSLTNGKNPGKIQQIEFMVGVHELICDTILQTTLNGYYKVLSNRLASNLKIADAGNNAFFIESNVPIPASSWHYIKEMGESIEDFIFPSELGNNASSANGYRAGCFIENVNTLVDGRYKEWVCGGRLLDGGYSGIPCLNCNCALTFNSWYLSGRASGSGGNRGEWGAPVA